MKKIEGLVYGLTLLAASSAQAIIIDYVELTETAGALGESAWSSLAVTDGGFTTSVSGRNSATGADAWAYLDYNHAGLGVCKKLNGQAVAGQDTAGDNHQGDTARPGNGGNICAPSSDDNTTFNEELLFVFDQTVTVNKIWLNNTHDADKQIKDPETVSVKLGDGPATSIAVPGNGYAMGNSYNNNAGLFASADDFIGSWVVQAGEVLLLSFGGSLAEQFYVSGIDVELTGSPPSGDPFNVPVPGTLVLMGSALFGLGLFRRNKRIS